MVGQTELRNHDVDRDHADVEHVRDQDQHGDQLLARKALDGQAVGKGNGQHERAEHAEEQDLERVHERNQEAVVAQKLGVRGERPLPGRQHHALQVAADEGGGAQTEHDRGPERDRNHDQEEDQDAVDDDAEGLVRRGQADDRGSLRLQGILFLCHIRPP